MGKDILLITTLDTKGAEASYAKGLIEKRGHLALVMDISCQGEPFFKPDIAAEEIAQKAGSSIQEVRGQKEVGSAAKIMAAGAKSFARDLFSAGRFAGVLCIGGGTGAAICSEVMKDLPMGLPMFLLSTQKMVQAGIKDYVGNKDIVVMPCIADIAGLNQITKKAISKAVGAIVGMVESPEPEKSEKPLVFMGMLGPITPCGLKVTSFLEKAGYEVVTFHTVGTGGKILEEAIGSYPVTGVIELSLNEVSNDLFGGFASAGPNRLEAAGNKGIPQVITLGAVTILNFFGPETIPEKYRNRDKRQHNPHATVVKLNAHELIQVGETVARKLNQAIGPVKVLIPTRGFSAYECEGNDFYNPSNDRAFIESLIKSLDKSIEIKKVEANINDDEFAQALAETFLNIVNA